MIMKKLVTIAAAMLVFAASPAISGDRASCCKGKQCPMKSEAQSCSKCAVTAYKVAAEDMHKAMMVGYTGDVDTDFVRGMIPHHQGAVDMAEIVLKHGKDEEVKKLAGWIIAAQKQEIAMMQHWLTRRGAPAGVKVAHYDAEAVAAFESGMHTMHRNMEIAYTGDADVDFVRGMIPHHQGAVDMAEVVLSSGTDPEIRKLASDIVRTQNGEIAKMQRWLNAHAPSAMAVERHAQPKKKSRKTTTHHH
jgi:uncharacterized protein (DUF305 family)